MAWLSLFTVQNGGASLTWFICTQVKKWLKQGPFKIEREEECLCKNNSNGFRCGSCVYGFFEHDDSCTRQASFPVVFKKIKDPFSKDSAKPSEPTKPRGKNERDFPCSIWGGALRDDRKNGCEAGYSAVGQFCFYSILETIPSEFF